MCSENKIGLLIQINKDIRRSTAFYDSINAKRVEYSGKMQFINRAKHLNNKKRTQSRNHEPYEYDFDLMWCPRGLADYC